MAVQLPVENLEHIFKFLDGKSFSKVREVCKAWHEIIKEMQLKDKIWKQFCINEIHDYILEEILSFKSVPNDDRFLSWTALYKKWYRTKLVIRAPHSLKTIPPLPAAQASITCLRLSGNWIIAGHSSGHLSIWDQHSGELKQRCLRHLKTVVDIAMIDLLNLGAYYGADDDSPWDHHHAITISRDSYIQVICLLESLSATKINHLNYHSTDLTAIRVFDDSFAVSSSDNIVSVWGMKIVRRPHFHLSTLLLHKIIGPPDNLLNLGLWHNRVRCISHGGKLRVFETGRDEWADILCLKETYSSQSINRLVTITKSFLFRDHIIVMFTNDGRMVISVNGEFNNQYSLMETLQTLIISVALRGALLVLGGENGKVYVFHVPQTRCLLNLNLSKPSFSKRLSEASITSLDILFDVESPVVVASTNESIFILRWFTALSSHQEIKQSEIKHRWPN